MPTDVATDADRLLNYLADRGGAAEVPPGRSLFRVIGEDLEWTRAEVTAVVGELEADGTLVREVRDRRTYRLAVVASGADATAPAEKAAAPEDATGTAAPQPVTETVPSAPAGSSWAPIVAPEPEPAPAKGSRFGRRSKTGKAPKEPKSMSGVVYEIREMSNTSFEGLQGKVLARFKGPGEAFAEIRRLNLLRSGGKFTPRVVVRVGPDGSEDIAIPFNERARPVHFDYKLSGNRV